jgi:hypothetical protein
VAHDPEDRQLDLDLLAAAWTSYVSAWWPPGRGLGYEHGFTHQVVDLVSAIAENRQPAPSFEDGLRVQRVLGAVEDSAAHDSGWTEIS